MSRPRSCSPPALAGFVFFASLASSPLAAGPPSVIAYDVPAGTVGNQENHAGSLGHDFDVQLDILITRIGVFDSGSDGLLIPITARLFNRQTLEELGSVEFTPEDPGVLVGGSRFKEFEMELAAGFQGTISTGGYGPFEPNGNGLGVPDPKYSKMNDGGCAILFTGGGRFGGDPNGFPDTWDGGPPNRYAAGTFEYTPLESFPAPTGAIAYNVPFGTVGNQVNHPGTLGMDFDVRTAVNVTRLGVFDSGSDGLMRTITVQIYARVPQVSLATLTFTPEDPGDPIEGSWFKDLDPPLSLPEGFKCSVVAEGYGDTEPNGNGLQNPANVFSTLDGGGCALAFVGGGRFGNPGQFPTFFDSGPPNRFGAGTFEFEIDPTPPTPPPDTPENLVPTAGDGKVDLTWDASAGITPAATYRVFRAASPAAVFTQIAVVATTSYMDSPLPNEVPVCYQVRAVAAGGLESFDSFIRCAIPVGPQPPGRFIAYEVAGGVAGNQAHGGALGMDFDVTEDITVTRLGVFDDLSDGLTVPITAEIYDRVTMTPLATVDFAPDNPGILIDGSRFKTLVTPLDLLAGFQGTVTAGGYGGSERNGNLGLGAIDGLSTDDGGCRINFVGGGRFADIPGVFPTNVDGGPPQRYASGTFEFESLGPPIDPTPVPPSGLIAAPTAATVRLSWTPPPVRACVLTPTGYRVMRSAGGAAAVLLADVAGTSHEDTTAVAGTDYCYTVRTLAAGGVVGGDSVPACATPGRYIAYVVPSGTEGAQIDAQSVSMDFNVLLDIQVTRIGAFDSAGDGFALPITIRIYDRDSGEELRSVAFDFGADGELLNGSRFKDLVPPLDLAAGFNGMILAEGYGDGEPNGVNGPWYTNSGPCSVFFDGHGRLGPVSPGPPALLPPMNGDGKSDFYAAGTFEFAAQETGSLHDGIAYVIPEGTVGNQGNHTGALGLDFDVEVGIQVTRLGVFDSGSDGLMRTIQARLYDRDTREILAEQVFSTEDPGELVGGSRFKPLPEPLSLAPGFHGCMVAAGYGATEPDGNQFAGTDLDITTDDGGCAIRFVGGGRFGALASIFPPLIDNGPANRYAAGTFEFEIEGGTPEPQFKRGDGDGSGVLNITDPIFVLNALFTGGPAIQCPDAADADDTGGLNITDPIRVLNFLFAGGPPPLAPGPTNCGRDPSVDGLGCPVYRGC